MPYYSIPDDDDVKEFDEYNPTPYASGYDIEVTYGRPLPPSDHICYPSTHGDFDYHRPTFSYAEPCAYAQDALQTEYASYSRPSPTPNNYGPPHASNWKKHQPHNYQSPDTEYEASQYGYGGRSEYASSGYGGRSEYGSSGYGGRSSESEYGRKGSYGEEYGGGERPSYGRSEEEDYRKQYGGDGSYGRKKYDHHGSSDDDDDDGSDDDKRNHRHRHHKQRYDDE